MLAKECLCFGICYLGGSSLSFQGVSPAKEQLAQLIADPLGRRTAKTDVSPLVDGFERFRIDRKAIDCGEAQRAHDPQPIFTNPIAGITHTAILQMLSLFFFKAYSYHILEVIVTDSTLVAFPKFCFHVIVTEV